MSMAGIALLILIVALLTAAAASVRSVSRIWLRHWAERRLRGGAATSLFLERPQRLLLAAALCGGAAVSYLGGVVALGANGSAAAFALVFVAAALLLVVAGQLLPRAIAQHWPTVVAPIVLPGLRLLTLVLSPLLALERVARGSVRARGAPPDVPEERGDLEELLREGVLEGVGEREEIAIISGVVEFGDKMLRDVMTARDAIFALDERTPPDDLVRQIAQSEFGRVPIYRGTVDRVVGMIHAFDVLSHGRDVIDHLRPVTFAPATMRCNDLLYEMLQRRHHLAVVQDEGGRTAGIVTLEDLLEELVGDIRDEHDEPGPAAIAPAVRGDRP